MIPGVSFVTTGLVQGLASGLFPPGKSSTVTMSIARLAVILRDVPGMENMSLREALESARDKIDLPGYSFPCTDNTLCCAAIQATVELSHDTKPYWREDPTCVPSIDRICVCSKLSANALCTRVER